MDSALAVGWRLSRARLPLDVPFQQIDWSMQLPFQLLHRNTAISFFASTLPIPRLSRGAAPSFRSPHSCLACRVAYPCPSQVAGPSRLHL